ncbi:MAG: type II secretion system GspH family protein [Candidatus Omnitrophica bacterium]|nr:type II secretion system GspH family protein [Candidatus Omnitrophota bacterium]MBU1925489.1 type II secretion system GspH family protein [Candidatus Omnitrophota bacterium]MBU2064216.1 type II secretion system GspH family protein [Candidatus Omnitrophota bacterium]
MKRKRYRQTGITLIEILVSMSILAILVFILYSAFSVSLRGWKKSDNILQAAGIARVILERIEREISSAFIKTASTEFYCVGFDKNTPSGWRTDSIDGEFYFIAPLNPGDTSQSDFCEVGYWLDGQGTLEAKDDALMRFYVTDDRKIDPSPEFDFDFSTGTSNELSVNITGLEFEFFNSAGTSFSSWDSRVSGTAPARMKVTITVETGKGSSATNPDYVRDDFSTVISFPR